jgi:hypothetical protein
MLPSSFPCCSLVSHFNLFLVLTSSQLFRVVLVLVFVFVVCGVTGFTMKSFVFLLTKTPPSLAKRRRKRSASRSSDADLMQVMRSKRYEFKLGDWTLKQLRRNNLKTQDVGLDVKEFFFQVGPAGPWLSSRRRWHAQSAPSPRHARGLYYRYLQGRTGFLSSCGR